MDGVSSGEAPPSVFHLPLHTVLPRRIPPFYPPFLVLDATKVSLRCTPLFSPLPSFSHSLLSASRLTSTSIPSASPRQAIFPKNLRFPSSAAYFVSSGSQCQPATLTWDQTTGPYDVVVVASAQPCGDPLCVTPVLLSLECLPT
jgi:hypothetical protein